MDKIIKANEEEGILGHRFGNTDILIRALTRQKFVEDRALQQPKCEDQTALATLGDALLKAALTDILYHSGFETGDKITVERRKMEEKPTLAKLALEKGVGGLIRLGGSERDKSLDVQPRIPAETLEALIGAVYLDTDRDFKKTEEFVAKLHGMQSPFID
jgi:ribonuclease-3